MMDRKPRSILQEISSFVPERNKHEMINTRANHIIMSAIHLFEQIDSNYDDEEAKQLKHRFFSSVRGSDPKRFKRSMEKIKEGTDASKPE